MKITRTRPSCAVCGRSGLCLEWADTDTGRSRWACLRHTRAALAMLRGRSCWTYHDGYGLGHLAWQNGQPAADVHELLATYGSNFTRGYFHGHGERSVPAS